MKKPFVLYRRALGVPFPVARYAREDRARERARREDLFFADVRKLDASMREVLGIRTWKE